ncbi:MULTISPECIES: hypothetical protein [Dialister]|jgi:hypothetical protein|uniref:hypothetical protein n=1 Tax=Dialister TaxID=39948 RepID=UPI003AB2515C
MSEQIYPNEHYSPKELHKLIGNSVHAYNAARQHKAQNEGLLMLFTIEMLAM